MRLSADLITTTQECENKWVSLSIIMTIFFNNETLSNNLSSFPIKPITIASVYTISLFLVIVFIKLSKLNLRSVMVLLGFFALLIISFEIDNISFSTTNAYYLFFMTILTGFAMTQICSLQHYMRVFCNTLVAISTASLLITYPLKTVVEAFPRLFPVVTNSANISFTNAYITYVIRSDIDIVRNYGIFREPGVYAVFLLIAIAFLMQQKKESIFQLVVLTLALLTTFSLPGYIAFLLLMINKTRLIDGKIVMKDVMFILAIIVVVITINFGLADSNNAFAKVFEKANTNSSSYQYRVEALLRNLQVWWRSPIFGSGIITGNEFLKDSEVIRYSVNGYHNTSSITAMLVFFGIGFTSIALVYLFRFSRYLKNGILFFFAIMIVLNSQLFIYDTILYTLILFGTTEQPKIDSA